MDELTAFGISSAIQPDDHSVINNAKELTAGYGDRDFTQNVCSIFDNIFRNWNYQRYPGGRFVEYAPEA